MQLLQCPTLCFFITDGSIAHCENNVAPEAGSNQVSEGEDDLYLTDDMDDVLRTASTGLEKSDGSQERVSYAIARITGYLRTIIFRAPELKERVHGLVTSIVVALSASVLDSDHSSMELLCTEIKRCIVALSECEQIQLPKQARKDASDAISMMQVARLDGDDNMRLRAIKAALYWINDYWSLICMKQSAYDMLSAISCTLSSAPTDNKTRSRLVTYLNSFASDVAIYDPVNKMLHGGEQK